MQYENVEQILTANSEVRRRFLAVVSEISEDEASKVSSCDKWNVKQVIEHLAMVDVGIGRICNRLISEAKRSGELSDGTVAINPGFWQHAGRLAGEKLEAPDQVIPTGSIPISESITVLKENQSVFESMRPDLEKYDLSGPTFPHPYFGPLSAVEWLVVQGRHETRHTGQIERILLAIRHKKPRLEGG
jgi:uncharacterized damage-inducible protein DinB